MAWGRKRGTVPSWIRTTWGSEQLHLPNDTSEITLALISNLTNDHSTTKNDQNVPTYADSAANKHCFVNRSDFSTYHALSKPDEGQPANKGGQFRIVGHGTVTKTDLIANLISIGKLDEANCWALFGGGGVTFYDLLSVEPHISTTHALVAHSLAKPTNLEVWHRRFGHIGTRSIVDMAKKGLVDGLDIVGSVEPEGKCEDCIYGKQTARPYDQVVERETEVLERVYIDLWGPARVRSVGGAEYMMAFNDGGSSYRVGYFLNSKSADTTLTAFAEFHVKSERETGKKLIRVRVDMGFLRTRTKRGG